MKRRNIDRKKWKQQTNSYSHRVIFWKILLKDEAVGNRYGVYIIASSYEALNCRLPCSGFVDLLVTNKNNHS
jgi:hypothetical protein